MAPDPEGGPCTHIVEHTADFGEYVGIVLGFRRDPDCVRLTWHATPAVAAEALRLPALQSEVA